MPPPPPPPPPPPVFLPTLPCLFCGCDLSIISQDGGTRITAIEQMCVLYCAQEAEVKLQKVEQDVSEADGQTDANRCIPRQETGHSVYVYACVRG